MPKVGMEPIRRNQLINATIYCIDNYGISDVTIAQIAQRAGLSTGIISHYFGGKMGLLRESMLELMRQLHEGILLKNRAENIQNDPKKAIEIIIECNFDTSKSAMRVWLSFWAMSMYQPELNRLQRINDNRLYSNLLSHFKKLLPREYANDAARGLAALIDGLWLHGSLRSSKFDSIQARKIALSFFYNICKQYSA
ncbi:transcriptional regulator BetI [Ursidibacter arcticus]|uniref:transcriptional regulator BetI n=1 Tax=Ursidibacter TaxID=1855419 RepID=UPI0012F8C1F6|nr:MULTISPECIES: transcriptional regulator BetI [Ursidibacter]KAE9532458.1 hypothetical protein A1D25_09050 [Ursidibacter arcticus]MBV6540924.1 transcriptional regulator BetI [Ursidibacter maritimus]